MHMVSGGCWWSLIHFDVILLFSGMGVPMISLWWSLVVSGVAKEDHNDKQDTMQVLGAGKGLHEKNS